MTSELIEELGDELESITLIKSTGGRFDVNVDGRQVFSKKSAGRHLAPGEIVSLIGGQEARR